MLVGGLILFFWGFITHSALATVIPQVSEFKNEQAVIDAVRANVPGNGVYLSGRGVFAAVSFTPDLADKTKDITPMLIREFLSCCITALLLAMALVGTRSQSALGGAVLLGVLGVAAAFSSEFSSWNWYGFSAQFTLIESLDVVGGWFLTGLALGALKKKLAS
jgi:hypothetical protein